jgi:hypothetical protein
MAKSWRRPYAAWRFRQGGICCRILTDFGCDFLICTANRARTSELFAPGPKMGPEPCRTVSKCIIPRMLWRFGRLRPVPKPIRALCSSTINRRCAWIAGPNEISKAPNSTRIQGCSICVT